MLEPKHFKRIVPGSNGVFANTLVLDGRVVGTWKREVKKDRILIRATPFGSLKKAEKQLFEPAAERYGRFFGARVEMRWGR